jgi:ATP-dependent DNA helicase RecQ
MDSLVKELQRHLHVKSFRPGQRETIQSLLEGKDALTILPTGSGKSLIFQLASQLLPGITIVVSPLIALMKDQLEAAAEHGVEAEVLSSQQTDAEFAQAWGAVKNRQSSLLYVTPERLSDDTFLDALRAEKISLFVVDEAHCVTEWGESFRPSYLHLRDVIAALGHPTVLALTATAPPWLRDEIVARLGMINPQRIVYGTDRPNIFLSVTRVVDEDSDQSVIERFFQAPETSFAEHVNRQLTACSQGSGIIYCRTTAAAEETHQWLQDWGMSSGYYHGQQPKATRNAVQEQFMSGQLKVICATNAFGMGINKPDIRFVIHRDCPPSLESYYQEIGRAGRDGHPARALLIYRAQDLTRASSMHRQARLDHGQVEQVIKIIEAASGADVPDLLSRQILPEGQLLRLIYLLEREEAISVLKGKITLKKPLHKALELTQELEQQHMSLDDSRVAMMRRYAESEGCRRSHILHYFGDLEARPTCSWCDVDLGISTTEKLRLEQAIGASPFNAGDAVVHARFGRGVIEQVTPEQITVMFNIGGYKTLQTDLVLKNNLLARLK